MIWSTSKTFIKNIIEDCWVEEELKLMIEGDAEKIKSYLDEVNSELWQNSYTEIDYSKWTNKDFMKIAEAAKNQLAYIAEEE